MEFYSEEYTYYEFNENDKTFIGVKDIVYSFSGATGKFGLVDKSGTKITTMNFDNITWMKDGYYAATKNEKVGIMNLKGSSIVPMEYDIFYFYNASGQKSQINPSFYNDHFYLPKGKTNFLFDLNAKKITDTRTFEEPETSILSYEKAAGFDYVESSNLFYREPKPITKKWLLNNKIYNYAGGSYNYKGESLQGEERYWGFAEGLIVAMRDGKYGYLDYKGNEVIRFEFDEATSFELTGVASVKKDNSWFTIDRFGRKLDFSTITTTILKLKK